MLDTKYVKKNNQLYGIVKVAAIHRTLDDFKLNIII